MIVKLSKSKDGEQLFAPHFKVKEFACKDASDLILIDTQLVYYLEAIRDHFGKPVTINSAYRNQEYNRAVGGASESQHVEGRACDIVVKGVDPAVVADYADSVLNMGGVGRYKTFTHIDTRSTKSRWKG